MKKFLIALLIVFNIIPVTVQSETLVEPEEMYVEKISLPMSHEDSICTAWVIYSETGDVGIIAARAVLDVVLTRMKNRNMTACQVVKEKSQFSGYTKHTKMNVTEHQLTWAALAYRMHPVVEGCEYFHANYVHPNWKNVRVCAHIGEQTFYRKVK